MLKRQVITMQIDKPILEQNVADVLKQMHQQRHPGTPQDVSDDNYTNQVYDYVFEIAHQALAADGGIWCNSPLKVASAPTGSGKTTAAIAFIAGMARTDRSSTAAYIVQTVSAAEDLRQEMMLALDHPEDLVCWTSAHCRNRSESTALAYNLPADTPLVHKSAMSSAKILITTHYQWMAEVEKNQDNGVALYKSHFDRDIVFVDEAPELLELLETTPAKLLELRELVPAESEWKEWRSCAASLFKRLDKIFQSNGDRFEASKKPLVTQRELRVLTHANLEKIYNRKHSPSQLSRYDAKHLVHFLQSLALGHAFLSRGIRGRTLVAYRLHFRPAPNLVLLDATSGVSGLMKLLKNGVEESPPPPIDYSNLSITHIVPPKKFQQKQVFASTLSKAKTYTEWCKKLILAETQPGEKVFVVTHKDILCRYELWKPVEHWEGREVFTSHYGCGIGSNQWRHCTSVALLGAFHKPRRVSVGSFLGYQEIPAAKGDLGSLSVKWAGTAKDVADGDILRWLVQLANRGSARNIDRDGMCGKMKLLTTIDSTLLTANMDTLFPGATLEHSTTYSPDQADTPEAKLIAMLTSKATPSLITADMFQDTTGIKSGDMKYKVERPHIAVHMRYEGWTRKKVRLPDTGRPTFCLIRNDYWESTTTNDTETEV